MTIAITIHVRLTSATMIEVLTILFSVDKMKKNEFDCHKFEINLAESFCENVNEKLIVRVKIGFVEFF